MTMKKEKIISSFMTVALTMCIFFPSCSVFADAASAYESPEKYDAVGKETIEFIESDIDTDSLKSVISDAIKKKEASVDISQFNIPSSLRYDIYNMVWYEMPESLEVSLSASEKNGMITKLYFYYTSMFDNYEEKIKQCEKAADELLFGIKDNPALGDVEKILLIHDRLVLYCEYDYARYLDDTMPDEAYTILGVFINRYAVCSGYAKAYKYLLDKVGVKNYYISSDVLNHSWNIVYVDGKPYHVDTTWDDPVWDLCGRAQHNNFMQSSEKFLPKHNATDYDKSPVDTTYDDFYWSSCTSAFQLIGDYIYYVIYDTDARNQKIYRSPCSTIADTSDDTAVLTVSGIWLSAPTKFYAFRSPLCTDGRSLFYSSPDDKIYKYNPETNTTSVFYEPEITAEYNHIYGFYYDGKMLVTEINAVPNLDRQTKTENHTEIKYIDPDTCGKGVHLPVITAAGIEGTCKHPQGITPELVCRACKEVIQTRQNYYHEKETGKIDIEAPDFNNGGTVKLYCSCGELTDTVNINPLSCRDFDRDGEITPNDYSLVVNNALSDGLGDRSLYDFDVNDDGTVDVLDVSLFERVMHGSLDIDRNFSVKLINLNGKSEEVTALCANIFNISREKAEQIVLTENQPFIINGEDYEYCYRLVMQLQMVGAEACIIYDNHIIF